MEDLPRLRRRHPFFAVRTHWQVAIARELTRDRSGVCRNSSKLPNQLRVGIMLRSCIRIPQIERLPMILEDVRHRAQHLSDRLREPGIGRKSLSARGRLFVHPPILSADDSEAQA